MLGQYLPIVVLLALAFLFAALSFVVSRLLAPRRPNDRKAAPYECGVIPGRETPERFPVRFFLVAFQTLSQAALGCTTAGDPCSCPTVFRLHEARCAAVAAAAAR